MSEVTGPCSTLPGAVHGFPQGTVCDDHADRPAYRRVQGETDSFGSEHHDMCRECYDACIRAENARVQEDLDDDYDYLDYE